MSHVANTAESTPRPKSKLTRPKRVALGSKGREQAAGRCRPPASCEVKRNVTASAKRTKRDHAAGVTLTLRLKVRPESYAWLDAAAVEVNQRTRLAKSVLDSGWGMLRQMLQYKCEHAGRSVEVVIRYDPLPHPTTNPGGGS